MSTKSICKRAEDKYGVLFCTFMDVYITETGRVCAYCEYSADRGKDRRRWDSNFIYPYLRFKHLRRRPSAAEEVKYMLAEADGDVETKIIAEASNQGLITKKDIDDFQKTKLP